MCGVERLVARRPPGPTSTGLRPPPSVPSFGGDAMAAETGRPDREDDPGPGQPASSSISARPYRVQDTRRPRERRDAALERPHWCSSSSRPPTSSATGWRPSRCGSIPARSAGANPEAGRRATAPRRRRAPARAGAEGERRAARCGSTRAPAPLYATDASNYRQVPIGVVVPRTTRRRRRDASRSAASTARRSSAAAAARASPGQCCNVAVVLDFSKYLNRDPRGRSREPASRASSRASCSTTCARRPRRTASPSAPIRRPTPAARSAA